MYTQRFANEGSENQILNRSVLSTVNFFLSTVNCQPSTSFSLLSQRMKLYIKNMVCDRCIMAVKEQLDQTGLPYKTVQLGEVELSKEADEHSLKRLREKLESLGFELLDDKRATLVEKIKNVIIDLIHGHEDVELKTKLSVLLQEKLLTDYHYLTTLFSSVEGITIEKYVILQRIERAKELLVYNELSLGEIAFKLGYSSVQHLSQQFKNITGYTPSEFKQLRDNNRKPLDKLRT
jgi:AraC family transcriptional regulator